ncbi:MAG TPA: universal stress protein [Mycobacteriales bacterium]|nr:universal stress protein [Mycobacteriales bacterium]
MSVTPASRIAEVLMPVDLSHEAWRALPVARSLGDRLAAAIVPVYVDPTAPAEQIASEVPLLIRTSVAGLPVAVEVLGGEDVAGALQARIEASPGALTVMASHGRSQHPERAWGVLCDRLLMTASRSVLVVPQHFDAQRNGTIRRVAACIDAAAPDHTMLREGLALADLVGVPLVVVSVKGHGKLRPGEDDTYHVMAAIFDDLPPASVPVTAEALDDEDPADALVRYADRRAGTVLALAPGAEPRSVYAMTHSVSMAVAREARTPLLVRWHRAEVTV